MALTACLVCLVITVSGHGKKIKNRQKCGASTGHTTKLEQSVSLDIYA